MIHLSCLKFIIMKNYHFLAIVSACVGVIVALANLVLNHNEYGSGALAFVMFTMVFTIYFAAGFIVAAFTQLIWGLWNWESYTQFRKRITSRWQKFVTDMY